MKKHLIIKKAFSLIITAILLTAMVIPTQAKKIKEDDYRTNYSEYKNYYENTYVPSYKAYNQALADLGVKIQNTKFDTVEQAQRVISFLKDTKSKRDAFFGTRETIGTSRNIVPALRESMFKAAADKDFASAYDYCDQLETAVQARVTFLNTLTDSLNNFKIIESEKASASVVFKVISYSEWWYDFTLVVTNTSDKPIQAWTLLLSVDGSINYAGLSSGGYDGFGKFSYSAGYSNNFSGSVFKLSPQDKWQGGYEIPAGGSVSFIGNGSSIKGITGATLNGVPCSVSFSK